MPITGGKYVAPTWNNGSSPAINAAELQAISDTLAAVQTRAKVEVVSYTGTGLTGVDNPCSVTFANAPNLVIWLGTNQVGYSFNPLCGGGAEDQYSSFWLYPLLLSSTYQQLRGFYNRTFGAGYYVYGRATNSNKTISWYLTSGNPAEQLNYAGITYYFLGIAEVNTL